jgi:hypothetical protein
MFRVSRLSVLVLDGVEAFPTSDTWRLRVWEPESWMFVLEHW